MTPLTFELPGQMRAWLDHLQQDQAARLQQKQRQQQASAGAGDTSVNQYPDDDDVHGDGGWGSGTSVSQSLEAGSGNSISVEEDDWGSSGGSRRALRGRLKPGAELAAGAVQKASSSSIPGHTGADPPQGHPVSPPAIATAASEATGDTPLPRRRKGAGSKQGKAKQKVAQGQQGSTSKQQQPGGQDKSQPGAQPGHDTQLQPSFWILKTAQHLGKRGGCIWQVMHVSPVNFFVCPIPCCGMPSSEPWQKKAGIYA